MTETNVDAQVDVVEQEEQTFDLNLDEETQGDDTITVSKSEFSKLKRKAIAYDSKPKEADKPKEINRTEYTLNDEVVDLRLDGYSKQEVEFIMKNGGRKTLEDKNSYVSIAINARKEQARAEAEASKAVDTTGKSDFERKYTPEMLQNMSKEELKKILPHA
jgi:hypothetical protein